MTSNIFRVFGILLLLLSILTVMSWISTVNQSAVAAATQFMTAFANHDRAKLMQVLDTSVAEVSYAGERITGIQFNGLHVYDGAFSWRPTVSYSYLEMTKKQIRRYAGADMTPDKQRATVPLTDNGRIYLRQVKGTWKVFYIDKPSTGTSEGQ